MAWALARHGFDDISGAHVINPHIEMTVRTTTDTPSTPTSPSHSAHTAQLGRLEKNLTDNETAQLKADVHQAVATSQQIQNTRTYRVHPPRFSSRKQ